MQTIFFRDNFDTTFTPNIKNLCKRNGTYYYRKQVGGKCVLKSPGADGPAGWRADRVRPWRLHPGKTTIKE